MPLQETDPVCPRSSYGVDKHACELHARVAASVFGVASLGLRFFNVYGPRQRDNDAYAGVIAAFARGVACGLPLEIHGDGDQTRDFIYVGDVVVALLSAMNLLRSSTDRAGARVLNVCTGRSTSIRELARLVMALDPT
jgi:UDP-glucose 4-epimerase